jgi:hypothetical protein
LSRIGRVKPLEKNLRIPEKEELQEALKVADPLEKAVVLTGVSSGRAANKICDLTIGDFKRGYDPVSGITTLILRREREIDIEKHLKLLFWREQWKKGLKRDKWFRDQTEPRQYILDD